MGTFLRIDTGRTGTLLEPDGEPSWCAVGIGVRQNLRRFRVRAGVKLQANTHLPVRSAAASKLRARRSAQSVQRGSAGG